MIQQLHIENYAIIEKLDLDFRQGLSVFTGETGAGKSIIIGALSYLFGMRADTSIITKGKKRCLIEGVFSISATMKEKLSEGEIPLEEGTIIIRRTIGEDYSNIRINDCSVTLSFLQKLFLNEGDIHSQHDNQYLLKNGNHLSLLDNYLQDFSIQKTYQLAFEEYLLAKKTYENLLEENIEENDLDYWRYNLQELQEAQIKKGEEELLQQKEKRIKSQEKILNCLSSSLTEYQREGGANESILKIRKMLAIDDEEIQRISYEIEDIFFNLEEKMDKVSQLLQQWNTEEEDIEIISSRLFTIGRLRRKYNTNEEGLIHEIDKIENRIAFYENREAFLAEQKNILEQKKITALEIAKKLSEKRKKVAKDLEAEVIEELKELLLPNARFSVHFDESELNNNGIDRVEFLISMNKGDSLRPLSKVASGGELSRLMLGLKAIFTKLSSISLCVFDEIDTGVSGQTALAIGKKMVKISKNAQVLAITHLPNVAACAKNHYYIYKQDDDNKTNTYIRHLQSEEIPSELVRISGNILSESSLKAAQELYQTAQVLCYEHQ